MPRFGETAEAYDQRRGNEDDVWIKGFREGDTRIRFLQPTKDWVTYREHFAQEIKMFMPCSEEPDCPCCESEYEKTRNRSRKYAVNTLDETGRHGVHKVGSRMRRVLKGREERLTSITDRDYVISRSGSGMDTVYDIDPGEKYEIEDLPDLHDIGELINEAYERALQAFSGDDQDPADDEDPVEETPKPAKKAAAAARLAPAKKAAPAPAAKKAAAPRGAAAKAAANKPAPEPEPEEETTDAHEPNDVPDEVDFNEMSTAEIKAWLDNNNVDYKPGDVRTKLIALAEGFEY